ncbi:hypothetical protein AN958_10802 [Leucoagaricus sp. SymC.cos]|nr:hypothetical protein AN958_10802 [Leucoagaricus sp. SymC.cos]
MSFSITPTSVSSASALSSAIQLGPNPSQGWRQTPHDCTCPCKKMAYAVFNGWDIGLYTKWTTAIQYTGFYASFIVMALSEDEAYSIFVMYYMSHRVQEY